MPVTRPSLLIDASIATSPPPTACTGICGGAPTRRRAGVRLGAGVPGSSAEAIGAGATIGLGRVTRRSSSVITRAGAVMALRRAASWAAT
jgi:hypothetical protein